MNFAREGYPFIGIAGGIAAATFALALVRRSWALWLLAIVMTIIALWVAYFFRDPERTGPRGPQVVVSPADGKLILITEIDEPNFIGGKALRLSVFMNVFNVHVNRYPVDGAVTYVHYNKGKFLNAAAEKSSLENEQSSVGIESGPYKILVRQIAGLIARRIVTYSKVGDRAAQGERFGIIRFGSRVDIFIPTDSKVLAPLGTLTTAGTTVLAELPAR
ncbi:MAG TPA: phosphatidylserine decarboxylase family protein [Gemmatimonadaceae bacterium]|nr:phosphatidylserine decarboxylase family protein [Gemmatimonadaceae bacterium]